MTDRATARQLPGSERPAPPAAVHELIDRRWSPRRFAERPVPGESTLRTLFEAARTAPSSFNEQPWAFVVATRREPEAWRRVHACLVPGNRKWAESAPVLMLTFAKERFERGDRPNRHAFHDLGQAMAVLTVQATHLQLGVHQMAGFSAEEVRARFSVPEGWCPATAVAVGYPEEERPERERKPLDEMVFSGDWGEPAPWLEG